MSERKVRSFLGPRNEDVISPAFIAVATALGTGISGMLSNGPTTGGAIGTAVGGLAAYVAVEVTSASVTEASIIGGLAGTTGLLIAAKVDAPSGVATGYASHLRAIDYGIKGIGDI